MIIIVEVHHRLILKNDIFARSNEIDKIVEDYKPNILDYLFYGAYSAEIRASFSFDGENVSERKSNSRLAIFWLSMCVMLNIFIIQVLVEKMFLGAVQKHTTGLVLAFIYMLIPFVILYLYYISNSRYNMVIEYFNNAEKSVRVRSGVGLGILTGLPLVIAIVML